MAKTRLSKAVSSSYRLEASGTTPMRFLMRARSLARSRPSRLARPEVGRVRPVNMRMVVVLPAPLGPRKPKTSPGWTVKSIPSTARKGGWPLLVAIGLGQSFDLNGFSHGRTSLENLWQEIIGGAAHGSPHENAPAQRTVAGVLRGRSCSGDELHWVAWQRMAASFVSQTEETSTLRAIASSGTGCTWRMFRVCASDCGTATVYSAAIPSMQRKALAAHCPTAIWSG